MGSIPLPAAAPLLRALRWRTLHPLTCCPYHPPVPAPEPVPPVPPTRTAQDIKVKGVPDALRHQLQRRGVGRLALDLVAPKQQGLERVFQMLLG